MRKLQCHQAKCFYWVHGQCTSISALNPIDCGQFRDKTQPRLHTLPQRGTLTKIRDNMAASAWVEPQRRGTDCHKL